VQSHASNGLPPAWNGFLEWMGMLHDLRAAIGLAGWDREVAMPPGGAEARSRQLGTLSTVHHRALVDAGVEEMIETLAAAANLDEHRRAMVAEARRQRERAIRVPPELVRAEAEASSRCIAVWQTARPANDFAAFADALAPLLVIKRRIAESLEIGDEPYDALLDEFEPGARTRELEPVFADLRTRIVPIADRASRRNGARLPHASWPGPPQMDLAADLARAVGFDLSSGLIETSAHPFTQAAGRGDTRFTTRPDEADPSVSILSTLHELGHALYDQGLPPAYDGTVLYDAPSMGAHESQSRFWENHVGRLPAFWRWLDPILRQRFPAQMTGLDAERLSSAVNRVEASLIRIEADEVTYNLHIVLRFELELALIRGELEVADLPGAWADGMERLLGLRPDTDADGVMQDIHWAAGLFGYFPTYTLGNLYAAQLTDALEADLGPLADAVSAGEFAPLLEFMRRRVHVHGRRFQTEELMRRATGRDLTVDAFADHLQRVYCPD